LRKAIEDEEQSIAGGWGEKIIPEQFKEARSEDVIRKHEE
jgi:hypothetical protein